MNRRVLLSTPVTGDELEHLVAILQTETAAVVVVHDLVELAAALAADDILIAYGSGIIVPADLLRRLCTTPYNFHAASPDFPGRDTHHFAIYRGATSYGATAHVMVEQVDSGPIVGVERFPVSSTSGPAELLTQANRAMLRLFARLAPDMARGETLPEVAGEMWAEQRTTRQDFLDLCRIDGLISEDEFHRRRLAVTTPGRNNLTMRLHGCAFRVDDLIPADSVAQQWCDFTETAYRALLRSAKASGYAFVGYDALAEAPARHVVWRHDVDVSMHRAAALAQIEAEEGVRSTFFLNPHCTYYNLLEPGIAVLTRKIIDLGHAIGLHFDADAFPGETWTADRLEANLTTVRQLLETIIGQPVGAYSYHNPDVGNLLAFDTDMAGMVNAYNSTFRLAYIYASDSNGYWRFRPISELICDGAEDRLHILTHPEWWTPNPLPPRDRVLRAVQGRAARIMTTYDTFLRAMKRSNIRE
jgi:folate-dependent phosphoribosylglycinamide formyltransferase PurN